MIGASTILENICLNGTHTVFIASIQTLLENEYPRVIFTFKSMFAEGNIKLDLLIDTKEKEMYIGKLGNQCGIKENTEIPIHNLLGKELKIRVLNNKVTHTIKLN